MAEISTTEIDAHLLKCQVRASRITFAPMANDITDPREIQFYEDLSFRLKLAVEAIERPKGEIATSIGVSQQRLSNWITDQNKPDWFSIARFCRRYGVSADWVLLGELRGLPHPWADRWEQALVERSAARRGGAGPQHEDA